jgi:hypothetical protein
MITVWCRSYQIKSFPEEISCESLYDHMIEIVNNKIIREVMDQ